MGTGGCRVLQAAQLQSHVEANPVSRAHVSVVYPLPARYSPMGPEANVDSESSALCRKVQRVIAECAGDVIDRFVFLLQQEPAEMQDSSVLKAAG